ncbi:MAG: ATP-dependent helicase, partial [Planctomycetes bacterium]|nr:ATP-dependent helicase [Planctomycetota bacterium]
ADGLVSLVEHREPGTLPSDLVFWRDWTRRFFSELSKLDEEKLATFMEKGANGLLNPPDHSTWEEILSTAPPLRGLEYLNDRVFNSIWFELADFVRDKARKTDGGLAALLRHINPLWHLIGRVTLHLAENRKDEHRPFAFLATFAHRLTEKAQIQHLPLAEALKHYAGERDREKLNELLLPVRAAAESSAVIKELLTSRKLFQPQAWTISEAYRFLRDVSLMESSGLVVRVPDWWKARRTRRPQVQVTIGNRSSGLLGNDGILDFSVGMALDGKSLSDEERQKILGATDGLLLLRGKWVEADPNQLQSALDHWEQLQRGHASGIDFLSGMRMLAGTVLDEKQETPESVVEWTGVRAGEWLSETLEQLRDPKGVTGCQPGQHLNATLRHYQSDGVKWLWFMTRLGLGACLADDMGLGKTIQVIDLILNQRIGFEETESLFENGVEPQNTTRRVVQRTQKDSKLQPALLVVPASLIGNWKDELSRFSPQLKVVIAHRSENDTSFLKSLESSPQLALAGVDVVITTYTLVRKADWFQNVAWNLIVLDEAQAIKNASSAQTKAVKKIPATSRIVLTGTPVENQLGDLWSLFDFCSPGLLGTAKQFKSFVKRLNQKQEANAYGALRSLVRPYILRRMKTDPSVVPELPEKTEMRAECGLSRKQAVLYEKLVDDFAKLLETKREGIERRGMILGMLLKLKQICNHPSLYLGQSQFDADDSDKFQRLTVICQPIQERQEKVLVFTQFQSMCDPLATFLAQVFHKTGLILHGQVP